MERKVLYSFLVMVSLISCGRNAIDSNKASIRNSEERGQPIKIIADSTYYGICTDGTAMHTLQFVSSENDTITLPMGIGDDPLSVFGGLTIDSELAVTTAKSEDGNIYAKNIVNISGLFGTWSNGSVTINILKNGRIESPNTSYKTWKVENGNLILSETPFAISYLSDDSLCLVKNNNVLSLKRSLAAT